MIATEDVAIRASFVIRSAVPPPSPASLPIDRPAGHSGGMAFGRPYAAVLTVLLLIAAPAAEAGRSAVGGARHLELGSRGVYAPRRAATLYCTAAEAGDAEAAFALGRLYLSGRGVRRNAAMGAAWLRRAVQLGKREAAALIPQVGARLPSPRCSGMGRLVPRAEPPAEIVRMVHEIAAHHALDPALVIAIMRIESAFDPRARSPKGAMGLMQLMPGTAQRFGVRDPWDAAQNLRGGAAYLRFLLERYDGDVTKAAAAYNAGEGAVDKYGGVPPYAETTAYVQALRSLYAHARHPVQQVAVTYWP